MTTTAPEPLTLLGVYDDLVAARSTRRRGRVPRTPNEQASVAQAVARRVLVENHKAEYTRLYQAARAEITRELAAEGVCCG